MHLTQLGMDQILLKDQVVVEVTVEKREMEVLMDILVVMQVVMVMAAVAVLAVLDRMVQVLLKEEMVV